MAAKASQVSSLVIGLGQVEEESRQLIWPRPQHGNGTVKFIIVWRRMEWGPQSKWAADTYSILPYEYQERISCEYKEKYVYLIAGATMYDFPVIT